MTQLFERDTDVITSVGYSENGFHPATISDNANTILDKRYFLKDSKGNAIEDSEMMFRRVAKHIASGDSIYGASDADIAHTEERFYRLMSSLDFLPNSPTMMNAGTGQGTLSACFVLPLEDTMEGIAKASHDQAMVQKFGGGTGFSLSELRPKNSPISTTHGKACGPVETLRYLSATSRLVTQGGKRDGANMAVMNVHHPDILEFISCKKVEGEIHNFNISVGVTDEFMSALENGQDYPLYFRSVPSDPDSDMVEVDRLDAREVFDLIVDGAWRNGEPGMIFLDEVNRNSPVKHIGLITATNPCGEQPLLPNESCNLGSVNLANFVHGPLATGVIERNETESEMLSSEFRKLQSQTVSKLPVIDWERLEKVVRLTVHFLDNTIDVNEYAISEIEEMNLKTRKIGLGVMGFADMLVSLGIPYDSDAGVTVGRDVMGFIKDIADDESRLLALKRGPYESWAGGEPESRGDAPMRNACRLTVAPTGTISMIAGCSSGIEPLFSVAYRKQNILGGDTTLYYGDSNFERIAEARGFLSNELLASLSDGASLQDREDVPEDIKELFHVSADISPRYHVLMQAAFQSSVDAGISKTINFPHEATKADVEEAYLVAWQTGCKGITVYRAGSRDKEILTKGHSNDAGEREELGNDMQPSLIDASNAEAVIISDAFVTPMERPPTLSGITIRMHTGRGKVYVTLNYTDKGRLFEVFTAHGKAGGNDTAMAEALSRMVSLSLRSGVSPKDIVNQLRLISDNPILVNKKQVMSVPDAIAQVIETYPSHPLLSDISRVPAVDEEWHTSMITAPSEKDLGMPPRAKIYGAASGESCPECYAVMAFEEGCMKCYSCGFSKC